ncbi:hypothetical protein B566_EDAN010464 [Ephemera danica]|nr:hypothetical protein B566_EDAN010464 [Ephemera danica]
MAALAANGNEADNAEDTFRILIATDIHLGYAEKDAVRGEDSFVAFEEILQIAVKDNVDFILLGGDLFHDGRPTVNSFDRCMSLLRHYCMGNRPIAVEFLSDPSEVFMNSADPCVNYMDPNLNCSLDMLSAAGLVNYFGRQDDLNNVEIKPLLFKKGRSHVAIYGLGALKEKRLHRIIRQKMVTIRQPEPPGEDQDWFNIFVLHQNRVGHKADEYVPEAFLPKSMNLIVWGHEHECRIKPEFNEQQNFYGESRTKHVGILEVRNCQMRMLRRKLNTVRPFVFRSISLADSPVQRFLEKEVESMLHEAQDQLTNHPKQPTQPLIRLKVEYESTDQLFNLVRFGLQFQGQVANPNDLIIMKQSAKKKDAKVTSVIDEDAFQNAAELNLHSVEELVENYFKECDDAQQLQVLSVAGMNDAMTTFLSKGDTQAIEDLIAYQSNKTETYLIEKNVNEASLEIELEELRIKRAQNQNQETDELRRRLRAELNVAADIGGDEGDLLFDDEPPAQGRGSRGGRATRGPRASRGTRGKAAETSELNVTTTSQRQTPARTTSRTSTGRNMRFIEDTDISVERHQCHHHVSASNSGENHK